MEEDNSTFKQNAPHNNLEAFNGIKLTSREIDIVACIISGRGGKATAALLSIAEKTVETHTRNIMRKLECNSHEGIREQVERSKELPLIRHHYLKLLAKNLFEKYLQKISSLLSPEVSDHYLIYWKSKETCSAFIEQLENNLRRIGVKLFVEVRDLRKPRFREKETSFKNTSHIIYILPDQERELNEAEKDRLCKDISQLSEEEYNQKNVTFLILNKEGSSYTYERKIKPIYMNINGSTEYYFSFLDLLQRILPEIDLQKITTDFKSQFDIILDSLKESPGERVTKKVEKNEEKYLQPISLNTTSNDPTFLPFFAHKALFFITIRRSRWFIAGACFLFVAVGIISILASRFINTPVLRMPSHETPIRAKFSIPSETALLERSELLSQIEERFKGENRDIKSVALVGIGGAGKTTLARQYAHSRKNPIVWEINAETKESLTNSFENLADPLSKTEEDKKVLRGLQEIKDPKEREEKILAFVKEKLRTYSNWFLIYDNVEKFSTIQNHLPNDANLWGSGSLIITTRDNHISNNSHVGNIIYVGALTSTEKLNLFMKIMNSNGYEQNSSLQIERSNKFLQEIPPFPLDVSLAAYYLKATNVPYEKYIEYLKDLRKDFITTQESILKEVSEYNKTRYHIVKLSLQQIINVHKDFEDLLLLVSLIDSQHIPRDLLESYKNGPILDNFIYNLKKYSFLINDNFNSSSFLSIHRSTQEASLAYLKRSLNLEKNKDALLKITDYLENYVSTLTEKEDIEKIKPLLAHYESFLDHSQLLNDYTKGKIEEGLGKIYLYVGQPQKAVCLLQESLTKLYKEKNKSHSNYAKSLMHLGNAYRETGDYDKAKYVLEESLTLYQIYLPNERLGMAHTLAHLGNVHRNLSNHEQAESLLKESLLIYKKQLPENHISLAQIYALLGNVHRDLGNLEESKNLFEKSLGIYEKNFSRNHIGNAWILARLGNIYKNLGNYEKAKTLLEESITLYKTNFTEYHPGIAWALANLGNIYKDTGEIKTSKNLLEKSIQVYTNVFSKDHIDIAWVSIHLGNVYRDFGHIEKAKDMLEAGISIYKKKFPDNHVGVAWAHVHLGSIYEMLGRHQEAKILFEENLVIFKKNYPEHHVYVAWILAHLANVYKSLKNYDKAKALLEKSLESYKNMYGETHTETARILKELGSVYILKNNIEKGENIIISSLNIYLKNNHYARYQCYEMLADIYSKKSTQASSEGKVKESQKFKNQTAHFLNQGLIVVKNSFPIDSPHISRIQEKIRTLESTS